jgi:flagellar hook assembly protein FlgD
VRVDVVDIRGRLVNTLREGLMEEGSHAVTWDGRDRTGTRVAAGVYLAVLKAGDVSRSRKVVLAN